jgi:hypothetical protein
MVDLTGRKSAVYIKKEYQEALDWAHGKVKKQIGHLHGMNHKFRDAMSDIQKYKKDIVADIEEREGAYSALGNLLKNEQGHEGTLWKETTSMYKEVSKNQNSKGTKIKQKTKHGDQEVKFASMIKVLDKYPKYQTVSAFKRIRDKIMRAEKNIKITKKKYNDAVSRTIKEISYFPQNLKLADDLVKKFEDIMAEGNKKLESSRFNKGILFKFSEEKRKSETKIHTLYYEMDKYKNTIQEFKDGVSKAKKQDLEEMDY